MNNNWLQSLSESYKEISIQTQLENLIEELNKEQPSLTENEIKEFILNELKVPSSQQLEKESGRLWMQGTFGKGLMGKLAAFAREFRTGKRNAPMTVTGLENVVRGKQAKDVDVTIASPDTLEGMRTLEALPPGKRSERVADLARSARAHRLSILQRRREERQAGAPGKRPSTLPPMPASDPYSSDPYSGMKDIEKTARQRAAMGIGPEGTTKGGDLSAPIVQDGSKPKPKRTKK